MSFKCCDLSRYLGLLAIPLVLVFSILVISDTAFAAEIDPPEASEGLSDLIEFVYVDGGSSAESSGSVASPLAVVSFTDSVAKAGISVATEDGELSYVEASNIVSNAALFDLDAFSGQAFSVVGVYYSFTDSPDSFYGVSLGGGGEVASLGAGSLTDDGSVEVQAYSVDDEGNLTESYSNLASAVSAQGLDDGVNSRSTSGVKTIVLDAGHGGSDGGAEGYGLTESKLTLAIATACRDELSKYGRAKVIMTRTDDSYVGLEDRAKIATEAGADLFVSFHINAGGGTGAEVWIPNKSSWYSSYHELGSELGDKVLEKLKALGLSSRGNQWKDYPSGEKSSTYSDGSAADYLSVIRNCRKGGVPAILIEHGFIDNGHDAKLLSDASYLKQLGVADAQAIVEQLDLKESPLYGFTDVFASTDHSAEIGWLASSGISEGFPDGSFGGMSGVARADMAAFLYRLAGSPAYTAPSTSPFKDVTSSTDHYKEICWLADTGISEGWSVSGGKKEFRPYSTVARADMAAFLCRFAAKYFDSSVSSWKASSSTVRFSDITSSSSHYEEILWLGSAGVSSGYSDGTYRANANVVRQDMAAFLYRLSNLPSYNASEKDKSSFSDVSDSTDHANAIWWMASAGISTGYADGTFGATKDVLRGDMAAFLYRLAGSPAYTAPSTSPFKDVTSSTDHYKEICWLAKEGISEGWSVSGGKEFRPSRAVGRTDMAAFLHRFYKKYGESSQFKDWTASGKAKLRFSDVSDSTSHSGDVWWMGATGISNGYSDGSYGVGSTVKRQDLAEFLRRLYVRCFRVSSNYLIMGTSSYKASQFVAAYKAAGKKYPSSVYSGKGAPTIEEFANILVSEAEAEGVKADVVFAQAMHETGWLQFGGDVKVDQCNFAGIGATGSGASGATFNDVRTGLRAQIQHLKAYASTDTLKNACVDPRFELVTRGCATTLGALSGQWAVDASYGRSIYSLIASLPAA